MNDSLHISGLGPLLAPEEVPVWPPAPGWFLVAFLLLLLLAYLLFRFVRKRKQNSYRLMARKQLAEIREQAGTHPVQADVGALNQLLKWTSLTAFPRGKVAALSGGAWQEFLEETSVPNTLETHQWELLCSGILKHPDQMHLSLQDWADLLSFTESWIRKHKNPSDHKPIES